MTFEESQKAIEGMLAVQREPQNTQLRMSQEIVDLKESTARLEESTRNLNETSRRHERRIEQLIGYSITGESERLDIVERLMSLERRINKLEGN